MAARFTETSDVPAAISLAECSISPVKGSTRERIRNRIWFGLTTSSLDEYASERGCCGRSIHEQLDETTKGNIARSTSRVRNLVYRQCIESCSAFRNPQNRAAGKPVFSGVTSVYFPSQLPQIDRQLCGYRACLVFP